MNEIIFSKNTPFAFEVAFGRPCRLAVTRNSLGIDFLIEKNLAAPFKIRRPFKKKIAIKGSL
ncbi:hypothetical protein [Candidatus Regiella endosymbiont of Tuberolachnus salignus]|uniref:hypothetical protein n=1 Tax=Candidatus Regiella endosymbiont of Tuberolachnus salignus TaxID=3077956 RepID=UPI0030D228A2